MANIQERLLIVRLHISKWNPWGYDKEAARKVAETEGSKSEDVHTTKRKISKDAVKEIIDIMQKAYAYHVSNTMPTGGENDRIITTDHYPQYCEKMEDFKRQVNEALDKFVPTYPQWVEEARTRLGNLFKPGDYPDVTQIRSKFSMTYNFLPFPSADNLVLNLVNGELSRVRESVTAEMNRMSNTAMKSLWDRTYDSVAHMSEILGAETRTRITSAMVDNMKTLCNVLQGLNFNNDPELESLRMKIESRLAGVNPEDLRKNRTLRMEVAAEAKAITFEISEKRKLRLE